MLQPEKHKPDDTPLPTAPLWGRPDKDEKSQLEWHFLVDRLVSLSAAGYKDIIPMVTSRMCQLWVPEGRNGALLAINISLKWAWKLQQFTEI